MDCFASLAMTEFNGWRRNSPRRRNRPFDLTKTDAIAVTLAPAAHRERIAVLEERALDVAGEFDRLGAVPGDFQQTAALVLLRAGDGAAA